jgi:hypothetical protein
MPYRAPTTRSTVIAMTAFVVLGVVTVFWLPEVIKATGAVFLVVPHRLGLVRQVMPGEVQAVDLFVQEQQVTLTQPGRYFVYYDFPLFADSTVHFSWNSPPRLMMTLHGTGERALMTEVKRGLRFYDTPFARGRPLYGFEIEQAGTYHLIYSPRPVMISFVPDYTTGRESVLARSIGVQFGVILVVICGLLYQRWHRRRRRRQRLLVEIVEPKLAEAEAFRDALFSDRSADGQE